MLITAFLLVFLGAVPAMAASATIDMNYNGKKDGTFVYTSYVNWGNKTTTAYHKIKLKTAGLLVVGGAKISGNKVTERPIKVTLLNSKKKVVQPSKAGTKVTLENDGLTYYGVKKGTYYIRVKKTQSYVVYSSLVKVKDRGGASKSKAYTVKKAKTATGIMVAGESYKKSDWFCIKPTASSLALTAGVNGNGIYMLEITGPGLGEANVYTLKAGTVQKITMGNLTINGSYYIRLYRKDTAAKRRGSCIYELYWE